MKPRSIEFSFRVVDQADLTRGDMIVILRGQLTIFRCQAERGLPISVESLVRTERFARRLEELERGPVL